jgi:hypothetical protein
MKTRADRDFLQVQILQLEGLLDMVKDHPTASIPLRERLEDLQNELNAFKIPDTEASVQLVFHGGPVMGSAGIDADFLAKTVHGFQELVKDNYSHRIFGKIGKRGKANLTDESKLYLTALPRGSFGVELTKLSNSNLFDEGQLANSISQVSQLVRTSATDAEAFSEAIVETPGRILSNLKKFLEPISKNDAGIQIDTGALSFKLSKDDIKQAYIRVNDMTENEQENIISGIFMYALPESRKFEFKTTNEEILTGKVSAKVSQDELIRFNQDFPMTNCNARFIVKELFFQSVKKKTAYTLVDLVLPTEDIGT